MKTIIIIVFALFVSTAKGQDWPLSAENGKITYQETIDQSGKKEELFIRAKTWVANAFKSAKDVIQVEDKDSGKLILKGLSPFTLNSTSMGYSASIDYYLKYIITCDFKDNKYRYEITNLQYEPKPTTYSLNNSPVDAEDILLKPTSDDIALNKSFDEAFKNMGLLKPSKKNIEKMKDDAKANLISAKIQYASNTTSIINELILSLKKAMNPAKKSDW